MQAVIHKECEVDPSEIGFGVCVEDEWAILLDLDLESRGIVGGIVGGWFLVIVSRGELLGYALHGGTFPDVEGLHWTFLPNRILHCFF